MAQIRSITDATFMAEITGDTPVLVDFWAPWCQPCRLTGPVLEQVADEVGDGLTIVKLNVDENPAVPNALRIQGIPTLVLFRDGKAVDAIVGYLPKQKLLQRLQPHLASPVGAV
jgi:thioredoxin 1